MMLMRLFGLDITRAKPQQKALSSTVGDRGGWLPVIRESFAGAFQTNVEIDNDTVLTYFAVFACMTLIAGDISKLRVKLNRKVDGVWQEVESGDEHVEQILAVLRKPNPFQTRIQFWENYYLSKLSNGNVYVLKVRDNRGAIGRLYVLDPQRVQPLVAPDGDVFYRLATDDISGIETEITVPASEVIHDRFNTLFHPLIGMSPITSAGLSAMQGHNIQQDSATFFQNRGIPGGILTAPGAIGSETATRLKEYWETNFTGTNAGKVAVVGDGLKFEAMRVSATDSQVIEQLRWTAEVVCSVFHVPPYKIGWGKIRKCCIYRRHL
jgi:HK97 family phage portal protein